MGGYYGNSTFGFQADSFAEVNPNPGQYYNQSVETPSPTHSHQRSYETMASASDDMNSKSTNPSSLNSSFDQLHPPRKSEPINGDYDSEFAPVNVPTQAGYMYQNEHRVAGAGPRGMANGQTNNSQPLQPAFAPNVRHFAVPNNPRVPIKLDSTPNSYPTHDDFGLKKTNSTKRQSWIKKTFGRRKS